MKSPLHAGGSWDDQWCEDTSWSCAQARLCACPISISAFLLLRKNSSIVPEQLNRVPVPEQRAPGKNTTVLNQMHTALFSCFESSGAGRWPGARVRTNERGAACPEASTFWTPEFVGLKVWQTCYEAPSQDGESSSQPRTPGVDPREVSVKMVSNGRSVRQTALNHWKRR